MSCLIVLLWRAPSFNPHLLNEATRLSVSTIYLPLAMGSSGKLQPAKIGFSLKNFDNAGITALQGPEHTRDMTAGGHRAGRQTLILSTPRGSLRQWRQTSAFLSWESISTSWAGASC